MEMDEFTGKSQIGRMARCITWRLDGSREEDVFRADTHVFTKIDDGMYRFDFYVAPRQLVRSMISAPGARLEVLPYILAGPPLAAP